MELSLTATNPNRIFFRRDRRLRGGDPCNFFQWAQNQPLTSPEWTERRTRAAQTLPPDPSSRQLLTALVQDHCPHHTRTGTGSNGYVVKQSCCHCHLLLVSRPRTRAEMGAKAKRNEERTKTRASRGRPSSPTSQEMPVAQSAIMARPQEFLKVCVQEPADGSNLAVAGDASSDLLVHQRQKEVGALMHVQSDDSDLACVVIENQTCDRKACHMLLQSVKPAWVHVSCRGQMSWKRQ